MLYNQNANSSFYRNLAQLTGIEKGIKVKTREEHVLQAGNWANLTLEAIANNNPKIFDSWNKWQAENYYQITLSKTSEGLVDGTYGIDRFNQNKLQEWKAKSQLHPELRESLLEAFKTGDFSKVLDPAIRMYNEYFTLNPNNITREGITDAKRYNVEIPKIFEYVSLIHI